MARRRNWRVVEGGRGKLEPPRGRGPRPGRASNLRALIGAAILFALTGLAVVKAGAALRPALSGTPGAIGPIGYASPPRNEAEPPNMFRCTVVRVYDGDTFTCADGTRVRVSAIAARELDGSCRRGHPCPAASAQAARAALRRLAFGRTLRCEAVNLTYDRVAAFCVTPGGEDLSCAMVEGGWAAPWERYGYGARCRA